MIDRELNTKDTKDPKEMLKVLGVLCFKTYAPSRSCAAACGIDGFLSRVVIEDKRGPGGSRDTFPAKQCQILRRAVVGL